MKHDETYVADGFKGWLEQVGVDRVFSALAELHAEAAVFAVDAERNIVFWSRGAEALLGYSPGEVLGQHCLKANRCEACVQGCGISEHGRVSGVELTLFREDQTKVELVKDAIAFRGADGAFLGGFEILRPAANETRVNRPFAHKQQPLDVERYRGLITRDGAMKRALALIRNVAETDTTVLVRGDSGTGKELVARALHTQGPRKQGPFEAVNCAALTPTLLESELFGHEKGSFTGAIKARPGLFRRANGGTVFLDEVAELPLETQAKLLRVLEEREVVPVGGERAHPVDVRVIAATHRSLRSEVKKGRFREDLMYRLRVVPIFLPPLRDRANDVELLLWEFIEKANQRGLRRVESVEPQAMRALLEYRWPGNIRELLNVVDYAFAVGRGTVVRIDELPPEFREQGSVDQRVRPAEAAQIEGALRGAGGKVGEAAAALGMSRATLWRKRKKYGIQD